MTASADPVDPVGGYALGRECDYWTIPLEQRPFVFRHMDELVPYPTRPVRHGEFVRPLPRGPEFDVAAIIEGRQETLASFMERYHTAALIVVKDGQVRAERYRYGNTQRSRWVMFSVTKSIVSTALGAAVQQGRIGSIDEPVTAYIPELRGSAYNGVSIRAALNMSSGVDRQNAHEKPGANPQRDAYYSEDAGAVHAYLRTLGRFAEPGRAFNYNDTDTYVLGEVVTRAVDMPLATFISKSLWMPAGMEDDAYMRLTLAGQEVCHGGFSATLRDIARFGMLAMDGGLVNGKQLVPAGWFEEIARGEADADHPRAPGNIEIAPGFGYTHHWWPLPRGGASYGLGDDDGFAALGIYGQQVYVVPRQKLVVVLQSANVIGRDPPLFARGRELATAIASHLKSEEGA